MNKQIATDLVDEFCKHPDIITPDQELFLEILVSVDIPNSSKFSEEIPNKQQTVSEDTCYHYVLLRKVLRNENVRDYQLSLWKKAIESAASALGVYSSDILSRGLRANKELVEIMAECGQPFSLLGKMQTYDYGNPEQNLYIITRPILVIPGVKDMKPVLQWEADNTKYEKEVGLVFRHPKKITPRKYFAG